jgi:hypothetical protein
LFALPCRLARQKLGRLPRLADLLSGSSFVRPASQNCSAGARSFASSRRLAWWELGHSPRLAYFLGGGLVVHPTLHTCSTGAHLFALPHRIARRGLGHSPRRLAWWGLGRSPRLADLLDEDLVGKWVRERFMGLALGTPFRGTRQAHLESSLLSSTQGTRSFDLPRQAAHNQRNSTTPIPKHRHTRHKIVVLHHLLASTHLTRGNSNSSSMSLEPQHRALGASRRTECQGPKQPWANHQHTPHNPRTN